MLDRICCPTCSMSAAITDHRHFAPYQARTDLSARRCRNCGETLLIDGVGAITLREATLREATLRQATQLSASA